MVLVSAVVLTILDTSQNEQHQPSGAGHGDPT